MWAPRRRHIMKKRIVTVLGLTVACAGIAFGTYTLTSQGGGAAQPARAAESTEIADYIASVLPHTSPDQAAALADGVVTFEENEEALTRYRACMEAAGYEVFDFVPAEGKRSSQAGFN